MKRDMDLLRQIALEVESLPTGLTLTGVDGVAQNTFFAHARWLIEAGFAEGVAQEWASGEPGPVFLRRLTWDGCEFIEAVRDNTLWSKAKSSVLAPGAAFTIDLVKEWFKFEISQGLPTLRRLGQ